MNCNGFNGEKLMADYTVIICSFFNNPLTDFSKKKINGSLTAINGEL